MVFDSSVSVGGLTACDCFKILVSTNDGFRMIFSVVLVVVNNRSVVRNESSNWLSIFVRFDKLSSGDIEARRLATSLTACRRGRIVSEREKRLKIYFNLSNKIRGIAVVNKVSFLVENVDGNSINVERIAPNATNKCNHRTDANDGRVHKRLYSVSIPL